MSSSISEITATSRAICRNQHFHWDLTQGRPILEVKFSANEGLSHVSSLPFQARWIDSTTNYSPYWPKNRSHRRLSLDWRAHCRSRPRWCWRLQSPSNGYIVGFQRLAVRLSLSSARSHSQARSHSLDTKPTRRFGTYSLFYNPNTTYSVLYPLDFRNLINQFKMKFSIATVAAIAGLASADQWAQWSSTGTSSTPAKVTTTTKSYDPNTWAQWSTTSSKPSKETSTSTSSKPSKETKTTSYSNGWESWSASSTSTKPVVKTTTKKDGEWQSWTTSKPSKETKTTSKPSKDTKTTATGTWADWNAEPSWTTQVVTAITTVVPSPTQFVHAGKTYTITESTTITITDCPCTISVPVYTKTATSCASSTTPAVDTKTNTWSEWNSASTSTPSVNTKTDSTWSEWNSATSSTPAVVTQSTW